MLWVFDLRDEGKASKKSTPLRAWNDNSIGQDRGSSG